MAIKRRKYKSLIAKTLVFSVLALSMVPSFRGNTYAENNTNKINLTNMNYYNLIVLGDMNITNSKIEGALAVKGNINISNGPQNDWGNSGNPEVGAFLSQGADADKNNITGKDDYKEGNSALLLGGQIIKSSGCNKKLNAWSSNGFPIVSENKDSENNLGTVLSGQEKQHIVIKNKTLINNAFENLKLTAENFSNECGQLTNLQPSGTNFSYDVKGQWGVNHKSEISYADGTDDVLVIKLPSNNDGKSFRISGGIIPSNIGGKDFSQFKKVIILSNATNVYFDGGQWKYKSNTIQVNKGNTKVLNELGSRIMWVFPKATKIEKTGLDIIGSLIAPNANFISHGSNNVGQVIVKSLNQNRGGEFYALSEYPSLSIKAKNKIILYGDKVNLSELVGSISSTGTGSYKYIITKIGDSKPIVNGTFETSAINDKFNLDNTYINPTESGNYEIKISGNGMNRSVKSKITVLKPQIKINKVLNKKKDKSSIYSIIGKIFSNDGKNPITYEDGKIFSFNLTEDYSLTSKDKGYVPVFINNQEWNANVEANEEGMILNSITRGTYILNERETGGYRYTSATLNGKDLNANGGKFDIGLSENNKVTLNGVELEGENPIIPITVTNEKEITDFFHSNDVIRNLFS